ncbi:MAG TPA: magnesium-translocating P-type ATPase [Thermoanaerobaculia bacterium]|nr:magnesium-translocating P-type ATPase [Thermoanaerobaculia bacterium]
MSQEATLKVRDPIWSLPAEEALRSLGTGEGGLSSAEAASRLAAGGPNRLHPARQTSTWQLLFRQFASPLVLMLALAAILSLAVHEGQDAVIILVIVFATGLLGFWQEREAADAVQKLLARVAVRTKVLRDGQECEVPLEEVVPGDVVALAAGALVPADALLLTSKNLFVDEATLTGETYPAEKRPGAVPAGTPLSGRTPALFLGTHVVSGTGQAVVVRTGRDTELGQISSRLSLRPPESDFERGLQRFGYLLLRVTVGLVLVIFGANVFLDRPAVEAFMFSLALAVGLVPELLPVIVGINLARGARRMADAKVIVKRLTAIESFGSMDVLCSDKTGTLTEGRVRLHSALAVDGSPSEKVLLHGALNAAFESGFANPIDQAIRGHHGFDLSGWRKLDEVPYDFVRKRLSILVERDGERLLVTKGALAQVLAVCSRAETAAGEEVPLESVATAVEARFAELSEGGLRTLGVAVRKLPAEALSVATQDQEADMTFLGFLAFSDPPKPEIERTLADIAAVGIRFKMITGDNLRVALRLARQVGIAAPAALTGPELRRMSDRALAQRAEQVDVFAEVEPNEKERIILALQKRGHVVGFLGDGINDASALHAADVGISVDSAEDVAKEAADIVLLEHDLGVLIEGVREGRRTFANTLKYIFITTSANFGNMLSMAGASLFLPFLPLLPTQILLNNFLSDFPAMTIASDRVDPELVARPLRWNLRFIRDFMIVFGGISSVFDLLTFGALFWLLRATPGEFRSGWFVESVLTELLILLVIRTRRPFFRSRPSLALTVSTVAVAVLCVALLYLPVNRFFELEPLPLPYLLALAAITLAYAMASEAAKGWFFRREGGWGGGERNAGGGAGR